MRQLQRTPGRFWFAAWALLASLLFGQLGIGPGLLAAWSGSADACCDRTCPCEEVADAGDDAHHDHDGAHHVDDEGSCPEDGSDEQCPPGCDDCTCCPGAVVAVAPSLAPCPESPPGGAVLNAPPGDHATVVLGRIFRPPQPSLV